MAFSRKGITYHFYDFEWGRMRHFHKEYNDRLYKEIAIDGNKEFCIKDSNTEYHYKVIKKETFRKEAFFLLEEYKTLHLIDGDWLDDEQHMEWIMRMRMKE